MCYFGDNLINIWLRKLEKTTRFTYNNALTDFSELLNVTKLGAKIYCISSRLHT